jgi:hypothetical protein
MRMGWRTLAAALDAGTAVCAGINAAYFLDRLIGGFDPAARRAALLVLALVSLGTMFEALAFLAVANEAGARAALSWAMVRALSFAGAAGISALIARRMLFR